MKKSILIAGAALSALLAGPALAQDDTGGASVAEIVVTAQKREERLQDVPAAVSVVSGDAIAAKGALNIEGAQYLVPALNFKKSGTTFNQSLFLRGVGTQTFSIAGEPSVSTVVDGVVYSRAGEAFSDLNDIDRIEVLRGPQGTLFGKNASAGVINIVTKRPGDDFGGFVEAGYATNGDEWRLKGAVDAPISDTVKSRIVGFYSTYDGNLYNRFTRNRVNGYEHWGVRGMVVADPTENLTLTLIGDYRKSDDDCCAQLIGTTPTNLAATVLPPIKGDKTREVDQNLVTRTKEESYGVSLQADYDIGDYVVTYIGSYREWKNTEIRDGDWLPRPYVGLNQLHDVGPTDSNTVTQELRIASPAENRLSYVLGAFYSRAESDRVFRRDITSCTLTPTPTVATPCSTPGAVVATGAAVAPHGSTFTNYSLFGQGLFKLTDRLRLIGGLRYTSDKLSVYHSRTVLVQGAGINAPFGPFSDSTSNDDLSGKAGVQYDVSENSVAYATYSRGYKGPAFNIFFGLTATGTNVIEAETSDSYEIGVKNTLLDGSLLLNFAAYYAKYHNFQANNPDIVNNVVVTRFTNAGTASTRGVEMDLLYKPARDTTISGGLAYTDAHINQFKVPTNGNVTGVVPSGTKLTYAPKWKGSLSIDQRFRTGGRFDWFVGAQGSVQSRQLSQLDASAAVRKGTMIHGYALIDLSAGIVDPDDKYRLTFQVRNLLDESFAAQIESGGPGGSFRYQIPREADRYYGVNLRYNY